jgi:hypothetical protein
MIRQRSAWPYVKAPDNTEELAMNWNTILPPTLRGHSKSWGRLSTKGLIAGDAYDIILDAAEDAPDVP